MHSQMQIETKSRVTIQHIQADRLVAGSFGARERPFQQTAAQAMDLDRIRDRQIFNAVFSQRRVRREIVKLICCRNCSGSAFALITAWLPAKATAMAS